MYGKNGFSFFNIFTGPATSLFKSLGSLFKKNSVRMLKDTLMKQNSLKCPNYAIFKVANIVLWVS